MRIFVPPEDIKKIKGIRLADDKSHYLISVLRCNKGDLIYVIDGKGREYEAEISEIIKAHVYIDILREMLLDSESQLNLILCQGILKGDKMDMVIQKTTELGIKEIIPMITERCLIKETRKAKRWQKIAEEAAEQSGRTIIPVINEPIEFSQFLKNNKIRTEGHKLNGFIFWEEGGIFLKDAVFKISSSPFYPFTSCPLHLLIGPEGGFAQEEVKMAEECGFVRTTLGRRILRAETAAISSVTLVQFLFENKFCYNIKNQKGSD